MAAFVIKDGQVYYNEFDISGLLNSVTIDYSGDVPEANVLSGDGTKRRVSGLIDVSISCPGYLDASAADKVIYDRIGNVIAGNMSIAPQSPIEGSRAYFLKVNQGTYNILGAVGDVAPFTLDASSNSPLIRGIVGAVGSKDATGKSSVFELGEIPDGYKMYAMLHVVEVTGTGPTLAVTVSSADNKAFGSPTVQSELTFTAVKGVLTHQLLSLDGPETDTFWRVNWVVKSGAEYKIFVALGIGI